MAGVAHQFFQILLDMRTFGFYTSLKSMRRRFAATNTQLNIRGFGTVIVRPKDSDYTIIRQVFRDNQYGLVPQAVKDGLLSTYRQIIAKGFVPLIVDAGANIGLASIWFAKRFPDAEIIAIEPDKENCELLRRNTTHLSRVSVREAAIGATNGFVRLSQTGSSATITTTRAFSGCPIITVDNAISSVADGIPFIIKIDIEGFESDLFSTNLDWIDSAYAIFIEPHDWKFIDRTTSSSFQKAMGERQFSLYLTGENLLYINPNFSQRPTQACLN